MSAQTPRAGGVVIRERVEVVDPRRNEPPATAEGPAAAERGFGLWLDSRWDQPLSARRAFGHVLWDTWLFGFSSEMYSPTSQPLSGEITAVGRKANGSMESVAIPVGALFDLGNPQPRSSGTLGVEYPPIYGDNDDLGSAGTVHLGLYRDTVVVSTEAVRPFGERGPDWFVYGYLMSTGSVYGDDLYGSPVEHTARCDYNEMIRRCYGEFRSGYYWSNGPMGGSYLTMILNAKRTMSAKIDVSFNVPQGGLGLGEQTPVRVSLKEVVAPVSDDLPVTVWFDRGGSADYGDLVRTSTGQRGDTLRMTLGEVRAGGVSFQVRDAPASFGFQVRIRVEPSFTAPFPPTPGYGDLYIHGATLSIEVDPALPEIGAPATIRGRIEDLPMPDPSLAGGLVAYTYDSEIEVRLTNTRTGEEVQAPVAGYPSISITLGDILSGRIRVTGFGEVTHTESGPYGRPPGEFVGLSVYLGDPQDASIGFDYHLYVQAAAPLTLEATPRDTVSAGDEVRFTVEAAGLDPATPITFSVPDLTLGGFVADAPVARGNASAARGSGAERVASVTRALSEVGEIRFAAVEQTPDSTSTVTVTASAGGRSGTVGVTVLGPLTVRLIRQNDRPVPTSGVRSYVMVSKVRTDRLLLPSVGFNAGNGARPFDGNGEPDPSLHYDPDTYRPEVIGAPDSLTAHLARFRFRYEVLRNGTLTSTSNLRPGAGQAAPTSVVLSRTFDGAVAGMDSVRAFRALRHVRLVSAGRPSMSGSSACDLWPPKVQIAGGGLFQVPGNGGACQDDDQFDGEIDAKQTIPVQLNDRLRVTVYVESGDGMGADTLGTASFPVGQQADDGYDAVRRVDLVWHEYENATGTKTYGSQPDAAAARMSEDWAQASIFFTSRGPATSFRSADLRTIARVQVVGGGGATGSGTFEVRIPPLAAAPLRITVALGDSAHAIAGRVSAALDSVLLGAGHNGAVEVVPGAKDGSVFYVAFSGSLARQIQVAALIGNVQVDPTLEQLDSSLMLLGSQAATAAGVAVAGPDPTVINSIVVPRVAIQQGDPASLRLAYAAQQMPSPLLFVDEAAATGDGQNQPHTLSHEAGHLLLLADFTEAGGDVECGVGQDGFHHPSPSNLLFCVALERGQRIGGPKRLTPLQHIELRDQQQQQAGRSLLKRP